MRYLKIYVIVLFFATFPFTISGSAHADIHIGGDFPDSITFSERKICSFDIVDIDTLSGIRVRRQHDFGLSSVSIGSLYFGAKENSAISIRSFTIESGEVCYSVFGVRDGAVDKLRLVAPSSGVRKRDGLPRRWSKVFERFMKECSSRVFSLGDASDLYGYGMTLSDSIPDASRKMIRGEIRAMCKDIFMESASSFEIEASGLIEVLMIRDWVYVNFTK